MKRTKILFAALSVILAASCSKEFGAVDNQPVQQIPQGCKAVTFDVQIDDLTKSASLGSDLSVTWEEGDSVAVYDSATAVLYGFRVASVSGKNAVISGVVADTTKKVCAVYPMAAATKLTAKGVLTVTIPDVQVIPSGKKIDGSALVSVANASLGDKLSFKNVVSLVKFKVSASGCTTVSFCGNGSEKFTGACAASGEAMTASLSALTVKAEGGFSSASDYYAAICPVTFSSGFAAGSLTSTGASVKKTTNSAAFVKNGGLSIGDVCTGASALPSTIASKADLQLWAASSKYYPQGSVVTLTADIDYDEAWTAVPFAGNFDGGNHSIYGSTSGMSFATDADGCLGLFSSYTGSEIKDLKLGCNPSTGEYDGKSSIFFDKVALNAGALAGSIPSGSGTLVDNVKNYIPISFKYVEAVDDQIHIGGLVGSVYVDGCTFNNCVNYAAISSTATANTNYYESEFIGGITGFVKADNLLIQDCVNYGKISPVCKKAPTKINFYGGIVGRIGESTSNKILRCKNLCTDTANALGQIDVQRFFGGILGGSHTVVSQVPGVYDLVIEDCENLSSYTFEQSKVNISAGGIVGLLQCNYLVKNCRNGEEGKEYGKMCKNDGSKNVNKYSSVAGIVGIVDWNEPYYAMGTIDGCVNYGIIEFGGTTKGTFSGASGIVGLVSEGNSADIKNCVNKGNISWACPNDVTSGFTILAGAGGIIGCNNGICTITDCENYGAVTESGKNTLAGAGGLVGYQGKPFQSAAGCKLDCTVSAAHNGGMIVGNNVGASSWGTTDSKVKVRGTFGTTPLDVSNFGTMLSGGTGAATCNAEYWVK